MNYKENVTSKPIQATYLQMNDTHTTQWSVELSVYTSYMCITVVFEVMYVKNLQIAKGQI